MNKKLYLIFIGSFVISFILVHIFYSYFNFNLKSNAVEQINSSPAISVPQRDLELTGWFSYWDEVESVKNLEKVMSRLTIFSPLFYKIMPDSRLGRYNIIRRNSIIRLARENNIPIAPTIGDEGDIERINKILYDQNIQDKFIKDLISEAKLENFIGWSVDFEVLKSNDQEAFSSLIEKVASSLHNNNLKLYVIVYGRGQQTENGAAKAQDYKTLGQYADQVQLMVFGYHNADTDPGGQTPLTWYDSVLQYATANIPKEKILVALSVHGNDWNSDTVEGLTYPEVLERIYNFNASTSYNKEHFSQVGTYENNGDSHQIWYEDSNSITEKITIARNEFGINKFALWRIGAEDPEIWAKIKLIE